MGQGPVHPFFYRECLWEYIRAQEFAYRLTRMEAAYVFEDASFAAEWAALDQPHGYVYLVSLPPDARTDRLDMSWVTFAKQYHSFEGAQLTIRSYWRGDMRDPRQVEILTGSPLTIVQRLTPILENGAE